MWKQFYEAVKQILLLTHQTEQNREEIKELRQQNLRSTSMHPELDKAKARIADLLQTALDGEEVIITQNERPILKLVPVLAAKTCRQSGSARGLITRSDDFDELLEDFIGCMKRSYYLVLA